MYQFSKKLMSDTSWAQTLGASILTSALAFSYTTWQTNQQNARADTERFIDGAQLTALETSHLIDDGYNALYKLVNSTDKKGWKEFYEKDYRGYLDFQRKWRQQLIAEHFKLTRYFGKAMADQLIHLDEIDKPSQEKTRGSHASACSIDDRNSVDLAKIASQIECATRYITSDQDIIEESIANRESADVLDGIQAKQKNETFAYEVLKSYETSSVRYIRKLDELLTKLGKPQVTVIYAK